MTADWLCATVAGRNLADLRQQIDDGYSLPPAETLPLMIEALDRCEREIARLREYTDNAKREAA